MQTLNDRLESWLPEEAHIYLPELRKMAREQGGKPTRPCSEDEFSVFLKWLREDDITKDLFAGAASEYRRARKKGHTGREWLQEVHSRIVPNAEETAAFASALAEEVGADLNEPPTKNDVLTYRLILNQFGGGASLAALNDTGGLPTN
ncbi:hypothetical protein [Salinibacter ruber]|jgi:hypothetical protein|uniref:Uncharacterized protein n=1 Tax=Salinibacter ruber TaxID=146919 RepID=A0A9X2Q8B5_9BACT|nr:hypothetical protein [Salinibacter ruber]MCS3662318.1 hypothetical protein [Salinibacter ruber]MCS3712104.1 hypothetical protein [Salinibacter ruber]